MPDLEKGAWCTQPEEQVGRPKEYIPGRIFLKDSDKEVDPDSTISSLVLQTSGDDDSPVPLRIQLWATPAKGIPALAAKGSEDAVVPPKHSKLAVRYTILPPEKDTGLVVIRTPAPSPPERNGFNWDDVKLQVLR